MSFEQISKYIYQNLGHAGSKNQTHLITNILKVHWDFMDLAYGEYLVTALVHKSFKHENELDFNHNERLEFFGDAVLQLLISEFLYLNYPELNEGELSKLRSQLVNEQSLANLARSMDLSKWVLLGKGELKERGDQKTSILSDTLEALIGTLYLNLGIEGARDFLMKAFRHFEITHKESFLDFSRRSSQDAKTLLQEKVMKKFKTTPEYKATSVQCKGRDAFEVELWVKNKSLGKEIHNSKKKAMQIVAKKALEKI